MTSGDRKPFSADDVLNAMRKVVEERGEDFVHAGACHYATLGTNEPLCLIGHVIHALDPHAFMRVAEEEARGGTTAAAELTSLKFLPEDFWTDEAGIVADLAQAKQDSRATWGDALYAAENRGADAP